MWLSRDFIRSQHLEGHAESQSHASAGITGGGQRVMVSERGRKLSGSVGRRPEGGPRAWRCVGVGEARERREKGRGSCGRASPATRWWAARPRQDEEEAGGDAAGGGPRESSAAEETREWPAAGPPGSGTH